MAFEDVKESIKWAQDGGDVYVYFTAHFARTTDDTNKDEHDTVRYAIGYLPANGNALAGDLQTVFANTGTSEGMEKKPSLSYRVEVHASGTIGVQPKLNGKPIGGMPVEKLPGSSVSTGLLRAASSTTAYTVSLDRQAKEILK